MEYVLAWRDLKSGITGKGTRRWGKEDGEEWALHCNWQWKGLTVYWLEPIEEEKTPPEDGGR